MIPPAPRSVDALIAKWRERGRKSSIEATSHALGGDVTVTWDIATALATEAHVYRQCADELSALVRETPPNLPSKVTAEYPNKADPQAFEPVPLPHPSTAIPTPVPPPPTDRLRELEWVLNRAEEIIRDEHGRDAAYAFTQAWGELPSDLRAAAPPVERTTPRFVVDALNGLIGLIQLLPDEKRRDLITNHRYLDALTASNRLAAASVPAETPEEPR